MCQYGTHFQKRVNWISTFEKIPQLCPFQNKIIKLVNQLGPSQNKIIKVVNFIDDFNALMVFLKGFNRDIFSKVEIQLTSSYTNYQTDTS